MHTKEFILKEFLVIKFPGGGPPHPPLDPLDDLVADILGKNNVSIKGIEGGPDLHWTPPAEESGNSRYCTLLLEIGKFSPIVYYITNHCYFSVVYSYYNFY